MENSEIGEFLIKSGYNLGNFAINNRIFSAKAAISDGTRQKISRRDKKIRDKTESWQKKSRQTEREIFVSRHFRDTIFKQISF